MNVRISRPLSHAPRPISRSGCPHQAWIFVALALLAASSPGLLEGQGVGPLSSSWSAGLAAGAFKYEPSADNSFPIIAVRLDRSISKWVRFEVGTTYTRPEIQTDDQMAFDPTLLAEHTNLFTVTLGAQAKWTISRLEPYGGIAVGFFGRYDRDAHEAFNRSDSEMTAGVFWTF